MSGRYRVHGDRSVPPPSKSLLPQTPRFLPVDLDLRQTAPDSRFCVCLPPPPEPVDPAGRDAAAFSACVHDPPAKTPVTTTAHFILDQIVPASAMLFIKLETIVYFFCVLVGTWHTNAKLARGTCRLECQSSRFDLKCTKRLKLRKMS